MKQQYSSLRDLGVGQRKRTEAALQESKQLAPQVYEQAQLMGARRSRTEGTLAQAQNRRTMSIAAGTFRY